MLEKVGYTILGLLAVGWLIAMIAGMIVALPWGLVGFVALLGFGLLFIKVLKDRFNNSEDDYYSKHVDQ